MSTTPSVLAVCLTLTSLLPAEAPAQTPGSTWAHRSARPLTHDPATGETVVHPEVELPDGFPGSASSPGSAGPGGWQQAVTLGPYDAENPDWSPNGKVVSTFPDGTVRVGSGTLIDSRVAITSGSLVHQGPGGDWASSVVFTAAWDGDDDLAGASQSLVISTWPEWVDNGWVSADQGYLYLQRPVGHLAGWQGYYTDADDAQVQATPWLYGAYPVDPCHSGAPDQLHGVLGTWDLVQPQLLVADTDWTCGTDGMRGAGVIRSVGGGIEVGSVFSSASASGGVVEQVYASRIDAQRYTYLHDTFIPGKHVQDAVDLTPLKARTDAVSALPGSTIEVTFVLANEAQYDPPPADYEFSVFFSQFPYGASVGPYTVHHDFGPQSSVELTVSVPVPDDEPLGDYTLGVSVSVDGGLATDATQLWDNDTVRIIDPYPFEDLGCALAGVDGDPVLVADGDMTYLSFNLVRLENAAPSATAGLMLSTAESAVPFKGGVLKAYELPTPYLPFVGSTGSTGEIDIFWQLSAALPFGTELFLQWVVVDPAAIHGYAISNAVRGWTQ